MLEHKVHHIVVRKVEGMVRMVEDMVQHIVEDKAVGKVQGTLVGKAVRNKQVHYTCLQNNRRQ